MKFLKPLIAPVLAAVLTAGIAQAAVWQWSKTAATNATADATINWSEGMSPSSVNDSARAMMARLAEWRDDNEGNTTGGGTSSAYTITTNSGVSNPPPSLYTLTRGVPATNAVGVTLAVDGGTAYPIMSPIGTPIPAGMLVPGVGYRFSFCPVASCGTAQWFLHNRFISAGEVPIGTVLDYTGSTPPNANFVLANGQCISRTTYATYFALVSTTYGGCDGSTTFAVPDLSNRVVAGTQMSGTARITVAGGNFDGNTIGTAGGAQNQTLTQAQLPNVTPSGSISQITPAGSISPASYTPAGSITGSPSVSDTRTWQTTNSLFPTGAAAGFVAGANVGIQAAQAVTVSGGSISVGAGSLGFSGSGQAFSFSGTPVTPTFTGNAFGSGNSHPIMPPTMVLSKIVRVL